MPTTRHLLLCGPSANNRVPVIELWFAITPWNAIIESDPENDIRGNREARRMRFLEFTIPGPPVSHQSRNRTKLVAWKLRVRAAADAAWGDRRPLKERLQVIVAYYHEGPAIRLD